MSNDTVLLKLEPQPIEPASDSEDLMLSLFLDLITKNALTNPENLQAYTEEMSEDDDELLARVAQSFTTILIK